MMERRRSQRIPVPEDRFGRVKATVPARIVDISRHGVQLEVPAALRPAVECDLTLPAGAGDVRIRARVQRCRAMGLSGSGGERKLVYRAGLEFVSIAESDRNALLDLVDQLAAGSEPPAPTERRRGPIKIRIASGAVRRFEE